MTSRPGMKKVLIVTGGGRGIGAAIARLAAADGYAVCLSYLSNQAAADEVVASIAAKGGVALAVQADVAVEQDVAQAWRLRRRHRQPVLARVTPRGARRVRRLCGIEGGDRYLHRWSG